MLKELIVGMLDKESVGLSCHLFSAFRKLSELLEGKGCKMAKGRWCFFFIYRSIAITISFVEDEECLSGSGLTVFLFMGICTPRTVI